MTKNLLKTSRLLLLLLAPLLLAGTPAAFAPPAETFTIVLKDVPFALPDVHRCTGEVGFVTGTFNLVVHITTTEAGEIHLTFHLAGTFTFEVGGVTYMGHFTEGGEFNGNNQNAVDRFVFSVHGRSSDGSRVDWLVVLHISVSASEVTTSFERLVCP